MLKYLIIILDDTSVSFCHYDNNRSENRLISIENLKVGLLWAMKENLMVQFVYPNYTLSDEYISVIDSVDHIDITSDKYNRDVVIFDGAESISNIVDCQDGNIVLRLKKQELFDYADNIISLVKAHCSLRIIIKDITGFNEGDFQTYKSILRKISETLEKVIVSGQEAQISFLTDRLQLDSMNNCNAGVESITLAPNGNFYICPAFYFDGSTSIGNPIDGLNIPNQQLYKLEYAPICRNCDAYHCKRCVWLNQKTTFEVNTPGREQCVVSHIERNESMRLLNILKQSGKVRTAISIPEIDYLDPFDKITR